MIVKLLDDQVAAGGVDRPGEVKTCLIDSEGPLFEASYQLLSEVFNPDVLEPEECYRDSLKERDNDDPRRRSFLTAAYCDSEGIRIVIGVNGYTAMRLLEHQNIAMLAIGNIATSPRLREMGFKGVGRALLEAAVADARQYAEAIGASLQFVIAEAEERSLGFWKKMGFKRPQGVEYFQPPLEYHANGDPVHKPVVETLLVWDLNGNQIVTAKMLRDVVATVYEHWFIAPQQELLSENAFGKAVALVGGIRNEVFKTIPEAGEVALIDAVMKVE